MKQLNQYITEKILINKDTKLSLDEYEKIISFNDGYYITFNADHEINKLGLPIIINNDIKHINEYIPNNSRVYFIRDGKNDSTRYICSLISRNPQEIVSVTKSYNQCRLYKISNIYILVHIFDDKRQHKVNINDFYIYCEVNENKYIDEKLLITKDTPKQADYSKFGKGIECKFKDCKIFQNGKKTVNDVVLQNHIDRTFNDDDIVYIVSDVNNYRKNRMVLKNINPDLKEKIDSIKSTWQRVFYTDQHRGYYLKEIDEFIILCIKDFYITTQYLKQLQYIIKTK